MFFSNALSGIILLGVQSITYILNLDERSALTYVYRRPRPRTKTFIVHVHNGQFTFSSAPSMSIPVPQSTDMPDGFEERLRQRAKNPLSTIPKNGEHQPHGNIPNTPLAATTISFLLGSIFSLALLAFLSGALGISPWSYYQLGFFVAAWAAFHWGEFAVTAGWNLDKCSVDCEHTFTDS